MTSSPDKISDTVQSGQPAPFDGSITIDPHSKMCSVTPWLTGIDNQHGWWYTFLDRWEMYIITPNGVLAVPFGNEAVRFQTPGVTSQSGASKAYCDAWNAAQDALLIALQSGRLPINAQDIQDFMNATMQSIWARKGLTVERSPNGWPNLPWRGGPATITGCN